MFLCRAMRSPTAIVVACYAVVVGHGIGFDTAAAKLQGTMGLLGDATLAANHRVLQVPSPMMNAMPDLNVTVGTDAYQHMRVSIQDRGVRGNSLVWTMAVVYGGLVVLAIVFYVIWNDSTAHQPRRQKPENGLPPGYIL
mmetsp:Transcript_20159/g.55806  ORF Transcript_20159/g.55806 Transcript_20159/m.55806 type:complete len:139 (-) Transcript_20159:73-489(-)